MNSALTRLMWKEYRAQRLLWIVLFLAAIVIQLIVTDISPGHDGSFVVVTVIVLCFAAASGSLLFAAEIEERTEGLLRMLPCPTRTLMLAKTGTMLLATLAMAIVLTMTHSVAGFLVRLVRGPGIVGAGEGPIEAVEVYALLAGILLVFGSAVFASLLSLRVLYAVGLTAVFAMSAMIAGSLLAATAFFTLVSESGYLHCQLALIAIIGLVACVVTPVFLLKSWHLGRLPRSFLPTTKAPIGVATIHSSRFSIWKCLLQRIASWPASHTRITAMLMWRELRSAVPFGFWWLLTGVIFVGVVLCTRLYFVAPTVFAWQYPFPTLPLLIFIHQCGQRTNSDDQRTGASLFLANIGVSPRQVWLTKTACWSAVMLTVGFTIAAIDVLGASVFLQPIPFAGAGPITAANVWRLFALVTVFVLTLFGSGHLMGCWIRRSILSFAASALLITAGVLVLATIQRNGWPDWITITPIILCFFIAAAATSRSWLDRATGWRLRLRQFAWIIIPFIVFPSVALIVWGFATAGHP